MDQPWRDRHNTPSTLRLTTGSDAQSNSDTSRDQQAKVLMNTKNERSLRADQCPEYRSEQRVSGIGRRQEGKHSDGEDRRGTGESECGHRGIAMTEQDREERIDKEPVRHKQTADDPSRRVRRIEHEVSSEDTDPEKDDRTNEKDGAESVGCRVDSGEEKEMIRDACPSPQKGQDTRDHRPGIRPGFDQENDRDKGEDVKDDLRRPHSMIVAAEDIEELFRGEGEFHIYTANVALSIPTRPALLSPSTP